MNTCLLRLGTPSRRAAVKLEVRSGAEEAWEVVFDRSADDCPDWDLQRFTFDKLVTGRHARLTVTAPGTVQLREVLAWKHVSAPRKVNSYYYASGHLDRSEQAVKIQKYRRMAWNSFKWGFNGWGFYSYYSPRGSAWGHFDRHPPGEGLQEASDYQVVYPGPRGVIRTPHSEALREGWEDWRLLHLLREQGREDLVGELMAAYEAGAAMDELRLRALRRAADFYASPRSCL